MPSPPQTLAEILFPDRDTRFGTLVSTLSDAPTGPHADNLVSNEDSYPRVVGALESRAPQRGVYLGVGPDQNFTLIAAARPLLAFILDYRRRNLLLHLLHKALFTLAPDRAAYLTHLTARQPARLAKDPTAAELVAAFEDAHLDRSLLAKSVADVADVLRPLNVVGDDEWADLARIQARLAGPGLNARFLAMTMYPTFGRLIRTTDRAGKPAHLLARESSYQAVRGLQLGDRIVPLVGDFAGPGSLPRLGAWLRKHRLAVVVVYVSDVEFFLLRSGRFTAYVENLAQLPWAKDALLIRTSTREIDHPDRQPGDSSTTIVRSVASFLRDASAGRIRNVEDLFDP